MDKPCSSTLLTLSVRNVSSKKMKTSFGANLQNVLDFFKSLIMSLNADDISDIALIVLCDRK